MGGRRWMVACAAIFVTASAGTWLTACQDGTSPSYVDKIRLLPDSAHVPLGESYDFRIAVFDQRGDSLLDRVSMVKVVNRNPDVVNAEVDGTNLHVTTLQTGSAVIEMHLGFGTGLAEIFVPPVRVDHIEIDPLPIVIENGGRFEVEARLFDADGDALSPDGHRISWNVPALQDGSVGLSFTDIGPLCVINAFPFSQVPQYRMLVLTVDDLTVSTQITIQ